MVWLSDELLNDAFWLHAMATGELYDSFSSGPQLFDIPWWSVAHISRRICRMMMKAV